MEALMRLQCITKKTIRSKTMGHSIPKKNNNAFAVILAGGSGTRMGNPDKPKQFLMLGSKPILVHTVEKFCVSGSFDAVLVLCPETWVQQTRDILVKFSPEFASDIVVAAGGITRNETVLNALSYIKEHYKIDANTVVVTHDAVRPFVTHRIIQDNLEAARTVGACDTVIPATDTIVESMNATTISSIPNRRDLYQGQTPQSFKLQRLMELIGSLSSEEKELLTDACKIFVLRGEEVSLVMGEPSNMKITYPQDMRLANALVGE